MAHTRSYARVRAWATLLACLVAAAVLGTGGTGAAATAPVTVTINVASMTNVTNSCTQAPAWNLGVVLPGATALSSTAAGSVCRIDFTSSNDSAMLRMFQSDRTGAAMSMDANTLTRVGPAPGTWQGGMDHGATTSIGWIGRSDGRVLKTTDSGATWAVANPASSVGANITSIGANGDSVLYAASDWSALSKSINGGTNWAPLGGFGTWTPSSVSAVHGTNGVVIGGYDAVTFHAWVAFSTNAGAAWTSFDLGGDYNAGTVYATSNTTAWAGTQSGSAWRTTNGGTSWTNQGTGVGCGNYASVYATDANHFWGVDEDGNFCYTLNGGVGWTAKVIPGGAGSTIHGSSATDLWISGGRGMIYRSGDQGATWVRQPSFTANATMVHAVTSTLLWAAGDNDARGRNVVGAGGAWTATSTEAGGYQGVSARSADIAVAVGSLGLVKTTTDGATWTPRTSGVTVNLRDVAHGSDQVVWAVGDGGTIIRSTDGGVTWATQRTGAGTLWGVDAFNESIAWAVGDGGQVLMTSNGGASWTSQVSGTANDLDGIDVVSATAAWASGDLGTIIRTTDGSTWSSVGPGGTKTLHVAAKDASTAWYVDQTYGGSSYTTNGGTSWTGDWVDMHSPRTLGVAADGTAWILGRSGDWARTSTIPPNWSSSTSSGADPYDSSVVDRHTAWVIDDDQVLRAKEGPSITDYGVAPNNWASSGANNMFGVCIQDVALSATIDPAWTKDANTTCTAADSDPWKPIPTAPTKVAFTSLPGQSGRVDFVWGARLSSAQPPGTYTAPVTFEVLAPNA